MAANTAPAPDPLLRTCGYLRCLVGAAPSSALAACAVVDLERGDAPLETPDLPTNQGQHQSRRGAPCRPAASALPASATRRFPAFVSHLQKSAHGSSPAVFLVSRQRGGAAGALPWRGLVGSRSGAH